MDYNKKEDYSTSSSSITDGGWHITTSYSIKAGETELTKKLSFINLNDFDDALKKLIIAGKITIAE